jgi:OmpA-OmpF porin, OOP family
MQGCAAPHASRSRRVAPAPPPHHCENFVVFFDFDESDLNDAARMMVADAVQSAKQNNFVHIMINGHADTMAAIATTRSFSERRAVVVKQQVVTLGISADGIFTADRSFSQCGNRKTGAQ